jgi:hypothetical protein
VTIAQLLNQNSFLVYGSLALGAWLIALIARRARRRWWLTWAGAVALAIGANLVLRTSPPREFRSADEVQQAIASGRPTLVEFYSNF